MRELARHYPDDADAPRRKHHGPALLEFLDIWWKAHRGYGGIDWHAPGGIETESQHPGANHFYIHAVEASPNPEAALASARVLETLVPSAGHLLHIPSHLYVRLGNYFEAVKANEAAASADRAGATS